MDLDFSGSVLEELTEQEVREILEVSLHRAKSLGTPSGRNWPILMVTGATRAGRLGTVFLEARIPPHVLAARPIKTNERDQLLSEFLVGRLG